MNRGSFWRDVRLESHVACEKRPSVVRSIQSEEWAILTKGSRTASVNKVLNSLTPSSRPSSPRLHPICFSTLLFSSLTFCPRSRTARSLRSLSLSFCFRASSSFLRRTSSTSCLAGPEDEGPDNVLTYDSNNSSRNDDDPTASYLESDVMPRLT